MATTRFWFAPVAPAVTPTRHPGWTGASASTPLYMQLRTTRITLPTESTLGGASGQLAGSAFMRGGVSDPLAGGPLVGSVVVVAQWSEVFASVDCFMRVYVRLVAPNGTIRAELGTADNATELSQSPASSRRVVVPINATAVAGDRLVVEMGGTRANSPGIVLAGSSYSNPDLPDADGYTATAIPWVELRLTDAPNPPTAVTATPDVDQITLTWAHPATGTTPTGYEVRVNGGTPVAGPYATSRVVTGLDPSTTYTLEVRATAGGLASSWVAASATTATGAAYRVRVRLGSHSWNVLAGDPPTYGPVLPLSFGWSVPDDSVGFPAQPDPDTCPMELVTPDYTLMAGVDIGTPMVVSIYTSAGLTARPLATFAGRVADLEAAPDPHGLRWRVLGVGYAADPGTRQVGAADWPEESGDARMARIMAEAGLGWTADAVGSTFEAREASPATARSLLEEATMAAVSTVGTSYGPARRVLVRPKLDANGDLDPTTPFVGSAVVRQVDHIDTVPAGVINRATTWRRTKLLDATWVKIDHPGGPTTYGDPRGPAYPPLSVPITDPRELADLVLDTTPGYRWLTGDELRLELWATQATLVADWFYRDTASPPFPWSGRAVIVTGIDRTPDGSSRYAGMLAGARLILEAHPTGGRLVVAFRLRPEIPAASTVTMRWSDEPPAATWAQELAASPTGTWYEYRTTPRP